MFHLVAINFCFSINKGNYKFDFNLLHFPFLTELRAAALSGFYFTFKTNQKGILSKGTTNHQDIPYLLVESEDV